MEKTFFIDQIQGLKESVYRIFSRRRRQKRIVADKGDEDFKFISGIILSYVRHLTLLFGQYKNRYEIIYHRIYEIIEKEIMYKIIPKNILDYIEKIMTGRARRCCVKL